MLHILILLLLLSFNAIACETAKKEGLRIFVSFSMPESLLVTLDEQARKIGAKLVIRGLKNNSFKETFSYVKSMNEKGLVIDIDPKAFDEFEVNQVPSFVINHGSKFDKIAGNVSVAYVLKELANKGDLPEKAKEYLRRLENENK